MVAVVLIVKLFVILIIVILSVFVIIVILSVVVLVIVILSHTYESNYLLHYKYKLVTHYSTKKNLFV